MSKINNIKSKFPVNLICLILIIFLIGCRNNSKVFAYDEVKLLKSPYPLNYPSSNPLPNEVSFILKKGDVGKVVSVSYGKDYKVYKVRMNDGKSGYLISGDNFKVVEE